MKTILLCFLLLCCPAVSAGLPYELMAPVCKVWVQDGGGSGVAIESGGDRTVIVTNAHVVGEYKTAQIERFIWDAKKSRIIGSILVTGVVAKVDKKEDVALIFVNDWLEWPTARFVDVKDLKILTPVIAVGAPFFEDTQIFRGVITDQDRTGFIQYDASIIDGCSGGAVWAKVDSDWVLIGLINASFTGTHISFAIPSEKILEVKEK